MDKQILKKKYAQPALKVVELRQRAQLLVGSGEVEGVNAGRNGYTLGRTTSTGSEDVWE